MPDDSARLSSVKLKQRPLEAASPYPVLFLSPPDIHGEL